jgi:hypothetical protein
VSDETNARLSTLADSLSNIAAGTLTVSVNNFPFLKIDGETKTLDVEITGLRESGIRAPSIGESRPGFMDALKASEKIAKSLQENGWRLQVFEGGSSIILMGRGVSSLTRFVWGNPLKLLKILSST